jgi:hypothetical protein
MSEEIVFKSASDFMAEIEAVVRLKKVTHLEAVLLYCEEKGIEIETAASIIKSSVKMKARIQDDAEELNMLPKSRKLPID